LRAIRGHYRRRVYVAFLIPALIAVALREAGTMLNRAAQALKDWRLHAKALTDYREGKISLAEARRRWNKTTKVGLAGADRFDKPTSTRTPPPPANSHHAPWTASISWRAVTLMPSRAFLQETVPRSPRPPPLGAVLIPPTASTGHS
jgi:hypothetical protein